jgi:hypothetical protein
MGAIFQILPLFGFVGAVFGLTAVLSRRTRHDEERWSLDRRKRERRTSARAVPPWDTGNRRVDQRRRAASGSERD